MEAIINDDIHIPISGYSYNINDNEIIDKISIFVDSSNILLYKQYLGLKIQNYKIIQNDNIQKEFLGSFIIISFKFIIDVTDKIIELKSILEVR